MTEMKVKKRGWVKNAAIIFLAIMLVLTFFSNTIMNHSLPEVATSYVSSGTITAKIRGSGMIEAFETYEVKLTQTRTVETVLVKTGDIVEVGAVLFMLSGEESEELDAAIDKLEEQQYEYEKKLVNLSELDFVMDDIKIQRQKEDLADAQAELLKNNFDEAELLEIEKSIEDYELEIEKINKEIKDIQKKISALGGNVDNSDQIEAIANQLLTKNDQISEAIIVLNNLKASQGTYYEEFKQYTKDHVMLDIAIKKVNSNIFNYDPQKRYDVWIDYLEAIIQANSFPTNDEGWPIFADLNEAENLLNDVIEARDADALIELNLMNVDSYLSTQAAQLTAPIDPKIKPAYDAYVAITNAETNISLLSAERDQLEEQYYKLIGKDNSDEFKKLTSLKEDAEDKLSTVKSNQEKAKERLAELEADKKELETARDSIKKMQRDLEDMLLTLEDSKKDGETQLELAQLELQKMRKDIADQQKLVNELQSESVDSSVTAPVAGKITSINIKAGDKTGIDALMEIELTDRGYQLSFSVTYEQAKKIKVGDMAEVSNYYWGSEISAQLISIKNDPDAPREKKQLTFNVQGDLESGSQLSLTIGGKGVDYEFVVPNSAIRTDNDGDFVLIIEEKETPLGTRYKATRVEVKVLEKDDTNSAVTGGIMSWDYVITSANKPVEPGAYVRLADGSSR